VSSFDTIAAIATPEGRGGVGIIRLSGPKSSAILDAFIPQSEGFSFSSHTLKLKKLYDAKGDFLDEALVVLMKGPNSYTGEDVVEFQCHGGTLVLRAVLDACLSHGARTANPGEFTQRAFMNGKLDLTQAEAISDLINASSKRAYQMALSHLDGALGKTILHCREKIAEAMMLVEAAIDFSHEEHVYQIERDEVAKRIHAVLEILIPLRDGFDHGRRRREGISVAILGPPNAGKSTLFNALLEEERAIVTEIAGTTRDYLRESLLIDGVLINIIDTAGLRETEDRVEAIGVKRSVEISTSADVILWLVDASNPTFSSVGMQMQSLLKNVASAAIIVNKIDLAPDFSMQSSFEILKTNLLTQSGLEEVKALLKKFSTELTEGEGLLISRTRHLEAVIASIQSCEMAKTSVEQKEDNEIVALDLREALDALGKIVGHVSADDILNRIFSDFCVGK